MLSGLLEGMMEKHIKQNQVYAEVYAVLSVLGGQYIRKIPQDVLDTIADQRDMSYECKIDENKPLEEQNLSDGALALLASLKLNYWCETEQEKAELQNLLQLNEERYSAQSLSQSSKKAWIDKIKTNLGKKTS